MSKRIVTTDDATGNVVSQWAGGDEQNLAPVMGRTHREVPDDGAVYIGQRWNGTAFEAIPKATLAMLATAESRRIDFLTTIADEIARADPAAWNNMTRDQKVAAIRDRANIWAGLRVFIDGQNI